MAKGHGNKVFRSICWACIHSAAPPELQCSWDKTKGEVMVEGAKAVWEVKAFAHKPKNIANIISCPQFESMYDKQNAEKLRKARIRAGVIRKMAGDML